MFALLHLCDLIARFFPSRTDSHTKSGVDAIQFGMEALIQSSLGFQIAGPFQELLRRTAIECSIKLPQNTDDLMASQRLGQNHAYQMDDFIDACAKISYTQPINDILPKYSPRFSAEWAAEASALGFNDPNADSRRQRATHSEEERGAQNLMQIRNLINQN